MTIRRSVIQVLGGVSISLLVVLLALFCLACDGENRSSDDAGQDGKASEEQDPSHGRWRKHQRLSQGDEQFTPEQDAKIEELRAIGYASGSRSVSAEGVEVHVRSKVEAGLNFYTSGHGPEAVLMDMDGDVLHRWRYDFSDVWPDYPKPLPKPSGWWRRAHLFENGDILAIFAGLGLIKLDKDSKLLWAHCGGEHHDLDVLPEGNIYVLERHAHMVLRVNEKEPILEDYLVVLDRDGKEKKRLSLIDAFENSNFKQLIFEGKRASGDIFHTNSVEVLDGRIAEKLPAFAKGNVLTSMNALGVIAVVDIDEGRVVWAHKGDFMGGVHDPRILQNGNMIFFDNQRERRRSSITEVNPVTMETVWEYMGTDSRPFLSLTCGTVQRLQNGNTLVSESDGGRAFEVTADKQIVWEFYNPVTTGGTGQFIATLFEVVRLPQDFPTTWVRNSGTE